MELTQSPTEPGVHSGEDFVHIEGPRPAGDMSLSDSIVNVEKDDLLDEAEEEFRDSESIVSGGDAAGGSGDGDGIGGGAVDYGECSSETTKVELPEEFAKSVVILTCESTGSGGSCDVYLIGTAHVSKVLEIKIGFLTESRKSSKLIKPFVDISIAGIVLGPRF